MCPVSVILTVLDRIRKRKPRNGCFSSLLQIVSDIIRSDSAFFKLYSTRHLSQTHFSYRIIRIACNTTHTHRKHRFSRHWQIWRKADRNQRHEFSTRRKNRTETVRGEVEKLTHVDHTHTHTHSREQEREHSYIRLRPKTLLEEFPIPVSAIPVPFAHRRAHRARSRPETEPLTNRWRWATSTCKCNSPRPRPGRSRRPRRGASPKTAAKWPSLKSSSPTTWRATMGMCWCLGIVSFFTIWLSDVSKLSMMVLLSIFWRRPSGRMTEICDSSVGFAWLYLQNLSMVVLLKCWFKIFMRSIKDRLFRNGLSTGIF